jgi:hypothetical protein
MLSSKAAAAAKNKKGRLFMPLNLPELLQMLCCQRRLSRIRRLRGGFQNAFHARAQT